MTARRVRVDVTQADDVRYLRSRGRFERTKTARLACILAADLLEMHDSTAVVLSSWPEGRQLVEHLLGHPLYYEPA